MKAIRLMSFLLVCYMGTQAQHVGIVRKNYYSSYFDTLLNMNIQVLDSSTIRLGSINPTTGVVTNSGPYEYKMGINLTGATINPYSNQYYISSGSNLLSFDINSGSLSNSAPITGPFQTFAFQNYRFNPSDTTIYGLVPNNFYSTVYDSVLMTSYQVLDSTQIRFGKLNPVSGQYSLIGNANLDNLYTLAGNSIDPHQMIYYYSAGDTLVGVDLYTGNIFSQPAIQIPADTYFENFTYSCADTAIYGLARKNYYSTYYDSVLQMNMTVYDSSACRLSKINPNTGVVSFISPSSIGYGSSLSGSSFIDPVTMTYYFSTGNDLVGVSLQTGLVSSSVTKTFQSGAMYFDMMRNSSNCFGALKVRQNTVTTIPNTINPTSFSINIKPNPATDHVVFESSESISKIELLDLSGNIVMSSKSNNIHIAHLAAGMYIAKVRTNNGNVSTSKLIKQ